MKPPLPTLAHRLLHLHNLRRWAGLLCLALVVVCTPVARAQAPTGAVGVYYIGPEDAIAEAIHLSAPYLVRVDQPDLAQVLVINNAPLQEDLQRFGSQVQQGRLGLVLFCGPHFPNDVSDLSALLGVSAFRMQRAAAPRALQIGAEADPLRTAAAWDSAPELNARTVISNPNLLRPVVVTAQREPVVQRLRGRETTQVLLVGGWFASPDNDSWPAWPYFNYLVYRLVADAAAAPRPLAFADYPLAPVPQGALRWGLTGWSLGVMLGVLALLFLLRRQIFLRPALAEETWRTPRVAPAWYTVGFPRPLAGFLALLLIGASGFAPLLFYRLTLLPQTLIPWAQTLTFWEQTSLWLHIVWVLFDLGVGVAVVRYFAALRPQHPQEAFRYLQFYVWWQLLTGSVQMGVLTLLVAQALPQTTWAHLSYYVALHALAQFPGFLQVFRVFFRAVQRFDYAHALTALLWVGGMAFPAALALLLRSWGARHPALGEALGSVVGLGLGLYLAEWLVFAGGLFYYRRMGYSLRGLLLPAFNLRVAGRALWFGARLTLGYALLPVVAATQSLWLRELLPDAARIQHYWTVALHFTLAYELIVAGLFDDLLPGLAEALTQGYKTLARYYLSRGLHYGLWISLFLLAIIGGLAEFTLAGLVGNADALGMVLALAIWGAGQWLAEGGERVLIAAGRPALAAWLTWGEMAVRAGLLALLAPLWGVSGLWVAVGVGLAARSVAAWLLLRRVEISLRFYLWQSLVAPAGAALLIYNLARLPGLLLEPSPGLSLGVLWSALLLLLPLYAFLTALFGGWDDGGIAELRRATALGGLGQPVGQMLLWCVRSGALSPLHGRYPAALREMAEDEAEALTMAKVAWSRPEAYLR